eukprot:3932795-Rhodomonas_salina.2
MEKAQCRAPLYYIRLSQSLAAKSNPSQLAIARPCTRSVATPVLSPHLSHRAHFIIADVKERQEAEGRGDFEGMRLTEKRARALVGQWEHLEVSVLFAQEEVVMRQTRERRHELLQLSRANNNERSRGFREHAGLDHAV